MAYKPEPGPFQKALAGLDLDAHHALHVGDSPIADVSGAKALGLEVYWVNRYGDGYPPDIPRPRWEFVDLKPLPGLL